MTVPSRTSSANRAPPSGTLYTAAIPAPAPQATSSRRCQRGIAAASDSQPAAAAPASCGAASRPSQAPMATTTIERSPRPMLGTSERWASRSHRASDISPPPRPGRRRRTSAPAPVRMPAQNSTSRMWSGEARVTATKERAMVKRPDEMLDTPQQLDQRGAGETQDQADRDRDRPEARPVAGDDPAPGNVRLRGREPASGAPRMRAPRHGWSIRDGSPGTG